MSSFPACFPLTRSSKKSRNWFSTPGSSVAAPFRWPVAGS
jgi:hypothetical protein